MCDAYRRHLDVLNRGFGGYNTTVYVARPNLELQCWCASAKTLFDRIFAPKSANGGPQVRLVTIWFGKLPSGQD